MSGKDLRIFVSHPKRNHGPTFPKTADRSASGSWLIYWCPRARQSRYFRASEKNGSKGIRGEVLELIDVEVKISPLPFSGVRSLHGGKLKLRDEERAQEPAVLFPDFPLRQIGGDRHEPREEGGFARAPVSSLIIFFGDGPPTPEQRGGGRSDEGDALPGVERPSSASRLKISPT